MLVDLSNFVGTLSQSFGYAYTQTATHDERFLKFGDQCSKDGVAAGYSDIASMNAGFNLSTETCFVLLFILMIFSLYAVRSPRRTVSKT